MRSVAAIAWASSPDMPVELGQKLSSDPDARVRRTLATTIRDRPNNHSAHVRESLLADPRWSVRTILRSSE
jgi:hypothetical protein